MVALEKGHAVTFASNIRHGGHRVTKGLRCSSDAYISKMHACMHACIRVHTHTHAYAHTHARSIGPRSTVGETPAQYAFHKKSTYFYLYGIVAPDGSPRRSLTPPPAPWHDTVACECDSSAAVPSPPRAGFTRGCQACWGRIQDVERAQP